MFSSYRWQFEVNKLSFYCHALRWSFRCRLSGMNLGLTRLISYGQPKPSAVTYFRVGTALANLPDMAPVSCKKTITPHSKYAYLLTPWSRVLLEKLTGSASSQEIPSIFGTRRFITVLTSARHLSLSWANSIQSICCLRLPIIHALYFSHPTQ